MGWLPQGGRRRDDGASAGPARLADVRQGGGFKKKLVARWREGERQPIPTGLPGGAYGR